MLLSLLKKKVNYMKKLLTLLNLVFFASLSFANSKANVILIFTDDQGYQDLGIFGADGFSTPSIDSLASQGFVAKSFYVSTSVCTPSRAALQTGKYHFNIDLFSPEDSKKVFFPSSPRGMSQSEITIAEILKPLGYNTALIGKWHLGHQDEYLPIVQGYDYFYGIAFSNDMWLPLNMHYSKDIFLREGVSMENIKNYETNERPSTGKNKVPLMRNNEVIEFPAEQATLTKRYVDETIKFIENSKGEPFFVCLTPAMPHNPLFASEDFNGTTKRGLYGDVIEEIDFNIGRLVKYLKDEGLFENTLIVFSSDNGPYLIDKNQYGKANPLKGGKFGLDEGGVRVPCVITYPKLIKPNTQSYEIMTSIDILPTIAELTGAKIPENIDGLSLLGYLSGKEKSSPRDEFLYAFSNSKDFQGIRKGDWKLIKAKKTKNNAKSKNANLALYNLKNDISEKNNLISKHPEKAKELIRLLEEREKAFKASRLK